MDFFWQEKKKEYKGLNMLLERREILVSKIYKKKNIFLEEWCQMPHLKPKSIQVSLELEQLSLHIYLSVER